MHPVNKPEVMLSDASHNIDSEGRLTNEQTRNLIQKLVEALAAWTLKLKEKSQ
jgi:chromate reductase